jgi:excisionase family DNA binding protein
MSATPNTDWLTSAEAGAYLKISSRTVVRWARNGQIPAHRLSGTGRITWRFLRSELDAKLCESSGPQAEQEAA